MEYSPEELNYFRMCRIVVKLVPKGLRKIFKQEWDFLYSASPYGIWQDTAQNGNDFCLEETRRIRTTMNGRFLAIIRNGNTAEWDCSCLFSAILFSNTIGSTLGSVVCNGVDDLRQVRNDITHIIEDELTDHDFQNYVGRVLNAFSCLGLPVTEVEDVKNQTGFPMKEVKDLKRQIDDLKTELDHTKSDLDAVNKTLQSTQADLSAAKEENKTLAEEVSYKIDSFCYLPFTPPHEIIRRSSDIRRVTGKMQQLYNESNGVVSTIYLSGNPGCGKSQLARQLGDVFYRSKPHDTEGLVFVATLNAENLETLSDSYITLATKLGMTEYALTEVEKLKKAKPEETLKRVMRIISPKVAKFANWLMIVDNVVDLSLVQRFVPQTGSNEWGHGQVLITTQDSRTVPSNAPQTYHESLSEGMQLDDAVNLLKQVSQISDQEHVEMVAKVLECQPLALASAAFFVQTVVSAGSPMYSWTEYLDRLHQGQREATEEPLAKESLAYSNTMTTAVKLAIARAMEASEGIRHTFCFLSLCASESLSVDIAVDFVMANIKGPTVKELIKADILKSSLIVSSQEDEEGPICVRLHKCVHDALKTMSIYDYNSTQKHHCITTAASVFESHLRKHLSTTGYGTLCLRKLSSHSKVLCDIAVSKNDQRNLAFLIKPLKIVSWLYWTASAFMELSEPFHAKQVSELACDLLHSISNTEENYDLNWLVFEQRGLILEELCEYKSALFYHKEALTIKTKIYGEEHGQIAYSFGKLGDVCRAIEQYDQAREFYKKALFIIRERIHGQQHHDDASNYHILASYYRKIGEYKQAIEYDIKALSIRENIHGKKHSDVAKSYNNLAEDYGNIGEYEQAIECGKKALSIWTNIHGKENDRVAISYHNLASYYTEIEVYDQAIECGEKALNIWKKIHGDVHGNVAESYYRLALITKRKVGINEKGTPSVLFRKKVHGKGYSNVGDRCTDLRDGYLQAIECDKKALSIKIMVYGAEHIDVADGYDNLALYCRKSGQSELAVEYLNKALSIKQKIFGEEHRSVALGYHNLSVLYQDIKEYDQAIDCDLKVLSIAKKIHGEEHDAVADSYFDLALDYENVGDYNQAIECDKKVLSIKKKIHGEEHDAVADSYFNLACDYRTIGDDDQVIECHKKVLSIREKVHGEEHDAVAESYVSLAYDYCRIGDFRQAIECDNKALSIRKKIHGEEYKKD